MRITQQSLAIQVKEGLQQAYQRVAQAQAMVSSGRRINHFSDDPLGASRALSLRSFEATVGQYERNLDDALPFLQQADSTLSDVLDGVNRARELALQMSNDTYSSSDRQSAAKEVHQIYLHLLSLANDKVGNRFLFGGFKNGAAPFVDSGTSVTYRGDNGQINVQASDASMIPINLLGNQVFQGAGVTGGVEVLDTLRDLDNFLEGNPAPRSLQLNVNLDSTLAAGAGFSAPDAVGSEVTKATWSGEASYSTTVTVFDTLGQGHNLTFLFAKTAADTYKYRVVADSSEITGGTAGDLYQVAPEGTLVFAANGTLDTANSTLKDITMTNLANGAADITINAANLSFNGSTQSAGPSAVLSLQQSNTTGFNSALGRLDAAINQIDTFRAEIGSRLNSAQTAKDAAGIMKDRVIGQRSNIEDADALSTYSDFARYQNAFQAALQSASQVIQPTLLDFLK